jgi:hypothetical protein
MSNHAKTLRLIAEWSPYHLSADERAAVVAGAEALERLAEVELAARAFLEVAAGDAAATVSWGEFEEARRALAALVAGRSANLPGGEV